MSSQQRLILATVVSMLFFLGYSAIFMPAQNEVNQEKQLAQENGKSLKSEEVSSNVQNNSDTSAPKAQVSAVESATESPSPIVDESKVLVKIDSADFSMKIDTLGRISSMVLTHEEFRGEDGKQIELIGSTLPRPLEVRFNDSTLNSEAFKVDYSSNVETLSLLDGAKSLTLTQNLSSVTITKNITIYPDGHYDLNVDLSQEKGYFISPGFEPEISTEMMTVAGVLVQDGTEQIHIVENGDATGTESYANTWIASAFDRYYTTLFYSDHNDMSVVLSRVGEDKPILFVTGKTHMQLHGYIGPKLFNTLFAISPKLTVAIEYGWFTFIAKPMFSVLNYLHGHLGNWGWAIVFLTLFIRLLLYPLTYRGMVSMQKLKAISPQVKEIQAKYKGEPQKMQAKVMELYKKHGANPLGGCLPMLLQIPVFFAIYRVLLNAIELQGAPWILWIEDMALMDPYFVLPVLMGISMYYQQKMTPSNFTDPMQEKIFKFLPVIFTAFFFTFPAGLVLYWFTNNLFSIAQQVFVNRGFEKHQAKAKHNDKD